LRRTTVEQEDGMRINETPEWQALAEHHVRIRDVHLRQLFAETRSGAPR
jgi:hypothetical protein